MALIISATDFSSAGNNAVHYACQLAAAQNAQVAVLHSFVFPIMFSEVPLPPALMTDAQKDAEQQLEKLLWDIRSAYPGITINGKVIYGDIIDTVEEFSSDNVTPWLVVVGNNSGEHGTWPDSTLVAALKQLPYPVLAVPPETQYKEVQKMCFAFDNKPGANEQAMIQLVALARQFNAELHVLNAQPDVLNRDNIPDIDQAVQKTLEPVAPKYHILYGVNIDDAIKDFTEKNDIGWLVLLPRTYSFFEGLFHKSHTKSIVHHSIVPILALHESQS
jgi:nucleotide-binding universal stress UspA family protein